MPPAGYWPLPALPEHLIGTEFWPTWETVNRQNLDCLVAKHLVQRFAPDEERIHFNAPPFRTVAQRVASGERFWTSEEAHPAGISFEACVVIGDFGLGSDAPIVLDYDVAPEMPRVRRLQSASSGNRWVLAAESFAEMCRILELPIASGNDEGNGGNHGADLDGAPVPPVNP